jgi:hypothetical protein
VAELDGCAQRTAEIGARMLNLRGIPVEQRGYVRQVPEGSRNREVVARTALDEQACDRGARIGARFAKRFRHAPAYESPRVQPRRVMGNPDASPQSEIDRL